MIKRILDNDVFEAIKLMNKSTNDNDYKGYERNESVWISYFLSLVQKQKESPHALVIGYYNDNKLKGFLSASTFNNYYNNEWIMDVKDCIVDKDNTTNGLIVRALFNKLMEHIKKNGGKYWRADSVQDEEHALKYGRFLEKHYNGRIQISVRGKI